MFISGIRFNYKMSLFSDVHSTRCRVYAYDVCIFFYVLCVFVSDASRFNSAKGFLVHGLRIMNLYNYLEIYYLSILDTLGRNIGNAWVLRALMCEYVYTCMLYSGRVSRLSWLFLRGEIFFFFFVFKYHILLIHMLCSTFWCRSMCICLNCLFCVLNS